MYTLFNLKINRKYSVQLKTPKFKQTVTDMYFFLYLVYPNLIYIYILTVLLNY